MKKIITDPIYFTVSVLGGLIALFITFLFLTLEQPIKNSMSYYEIPEWGKYTCITNSEWFEKNKKVECWLLTAEPKMIEFIDTWKKQK